MEASRRAIWIVLVVLALGQAVLFVRLGRIESAAAGSREARRPPAPASAAPAAGGEEPSAVATPVPPTARASAPAASVPPAEIEAAVRRILAERPAATPSAIGFVPSFDEDDVSFLPRALDLTEPQIAELLRLHKERGASDQELGRSGLKTAHPAIWKEKAAAIEALYRDRVRNLLNPSQREQYERILSNRADEP